MTRAGGGNPMVTAIILLNVVRERINETAQELSDLEGMTEVFSVSGRYDLVAVARVNSNEELAELVTGKMLKIRTITGSETMLAFRTYSRHDLEGMFSVGFEE
jgi:DNA-binding Lrp family transcriptional regulator